MALYNCPECNKRISTDADACPNCGKKAGMARTQARWAATPKIVKAFFVAAVLFALGSLYVSYEANKHAEGKVARASAVTVSQTTSSGAMRVQSGQWFGYRDRELLDRSTKIAAQGDKAAWTQLMAQASAAGGIVPLKPGEEVFIEDVAMMAGVVKIRRKGETSRWWTNYEAVK